MRKTVITHSNPTMQQKAFTYYVKDYDSKKKVYILHNPITKDIKIMDKDQFELLHAEQHTADKSAQDRPDGDAEKSIDIHHH